MKISIQTQDFDLGEEVRLLNQGQPDVGATASFIGLVRDNNLDDQVSGLHLQHYPGMTEKALADIIQQAENRWEVLNVTVIHRVGDLAIGDQIVLVAVSSPHRGDAFAACEFIMDYLKTAAPFWKKERLKDGSQRWLEARDSDQDAMNRW
jgi:molybdopterin synthase catalytic subunit